MNLTLRKEIVLHIFRTLGIFADPILNKLSMLEKLNDDKFLIDKKIAFETEDKKQIKNNLWAAKTKIEDSEIKIIIADITEDISEFALILQMDNFMPCAMRLSLEDDDYGSMYINVQDNKWIDTSSLIQAKILVGIESLSGIFSQWEKIDKYLDMYKLLIGFLNFYEQDEYAR
jgi:hypothetical protein